MNPILLTAVTDVLATVTEWVTGLVTLISSTITSIVSIFYDGTTGLTFLGIMVLIMFGIAIVRFVLRYVRGFLPRSM